jgi:branched-chain amino acid transport system substrate-binding protein
MHLKKGTIPLLICALVLSACTCVMAADQDQAYENTTGIVIGALLPITGDAAGKGEAGQAALEVAAKDINDYFAMNGSDMQVELVIEDTATNPVVALEKLKYLNARGIRTVIGPYLSSEIEAVRSYADEHGIILISTASTVPSLAIRDDNVFRFISPDTYQANATASILKKDGIEIIAPICRNDIWGISLRNLTEEEFGSKGGIVSPGVWYAPGMTDFSGILSDLDQQVGQAMGSVSPDKVGVYAVLIEETTPIMEVAAGMPNLTQVRWYGSDGNVPCDSLIQSPDAATFAVKTNFTGPMFGFTRIPQEANDTYQVISDRISAQPDGFALLAYDTLWIIVRTMAEGPLDPTQLKKALISLSPDNTGIFFGSVGLDPAGDRSTSHYGFWSVQADGETFRWEPVIQYDIWSAGGTPELTPADA